MRKLRRALSPSAPAVRFAPLLAAALAGCTFVTRTEWDDVVDQDGDGVVAERFGGRDCDDADPDLGDCDADGDGQRSVAGGGLDCDDHDKRVVFDPELLPDADGDGFGGAEPGACTGRGTLVPGDCDDADPEVNPGVDESCDARDWNCDGDPQDLPVRDGDLFPLDGDADDHGDPERVSDTSRCRPGDGEAARADDCDDADAAVYPGAADAPYDGVDADCAGDADDDVDRDGHAWVGAGGDDCDDAEAAVHPGAPEICNGGVDDDCDGLPDDADRDAPVGGAADAFPDADGDGFGGEGGRFCPQSVPPGWIALGGDCDDGVAAVNPAADEHCDGVDDDCDRTVDENPIDGPALWADLDDDGVGGLRVGSRCGYDASVAGDQLAAVGGDCDDGDPASFPGAPEVCGDAARQDCSATPADDCDGDGWLDDEDCADEDPAVNPGRPEICGGLDDDCDGLVDEEDAGVDLATAQDWYLDLDGDGFGRPEAGGGPLLAAACTPPPLTAPNGDDCDDLDAAVHPLAEERCNGVDDDCRGGVDVDAVDRPTWYPDPDGDGFGEDRAAFLGSCGAAPAGIAIAGGDCAPSRAEVHPGAPEICDAGRDDDCDGLADEADPDLVGAEWWRDGDADGWGDPADVVAGCAPGPGRVGASGDCNDQDPTVNPGATERCNSRDDDCDGLADAEDGGLVDAVLYWPDADGDGFGDAVAAPVETCDPAFPAAPNAEDCDDAVAAHNPLAIEICGTGLDEDCDGDVDEEGAAGVGVWYLDLDGDTACGTPVAACGRPLGADLLPTDCDDGDRGVSPFAAEACDGRDEDCSGVVDDVQVQLTFLPDADGDGFGDPRGGSLDAALCELPGMVRYVAGVDPVDCDDAPDVGLLSSPAYPFEVCGDGHDNDCDDATLDDDPACAAGDSGDTGDTGGAGPGARVDPPPPGGRLWWVDADSDGYGDKDAVPVWSGSVPTDPQGHGFAPNPLDCADDRPDVLTPYPDDGSLGSAMSGQAGSTCAAYLLAGDYVGSDLRARAGALALVGSDGRTRARLIGGSITGTQSTLSVSGVDFVADGDPGPIVTQTGGGNVLLFDVTAEGRGLAGSSAGALIVRGATVVGADRVLDAEGATLTAQYLWAYDSGETRMGSGSLSDAWLVRSGPLVLRDAAAEVSALRAAGCAADCVDVEVAPTAPPDGLELLGALGAGLHAVSAMTLRHATVVGCGVGVDGPVLVDDSILLDNTAATQGGAVVGSGTSVAASVPNGLLWTWFDSLPPERWDVHLAPSASVPYTDGRGRYDMASLPGDLDLDALDDWWELAWFGTTSAVDQPSDGDLAAPDAEYGQHTWPTLADTDDDGALDHSDAVPLDRDVR